MKTKMLWDLQQKEQELTRVKKELKQEDLVNVLTEMKNKIAPLKENYEHNKDELREKEGVIQNKEKNLQDLLNNKNIKENKLYDGSCNEARELEVMQENVETNKQEIKEVEEEILNYMENLENEKKGMRKDGKQLKTLIKDYQENLEQFRENKEKFNLRKVELEEEIEKLSREIGPELLEKYRQIQKDYDNRGIAKINNGACSGCRIGISILHLREVNSQDTVHYCENCRRILVLDV
ncbi:C4-type zinc ribbon domain-containing protein [Desulfonispora thiosulfatigenes DSM 11270]|uniref:C4-type zinc ribbon domain-containing protein n=1 Tax=Desulfonispora thiosulfatigenes DSM 11270 TaxID=656914 RepID=A0A1W1V9I1_DESTI|nr:C4-type zinc ribbon domain-containing protein [Desulfonispora thiosulfatigenes]SMB89923.1 C4-type zinc ribbon domain-containing protein [Desulfonispora thiosulfatigenes DSM 11270]